MSPHALADETSAIDHAKYAVTRNAFIPGESPATALADGYYQPWEHVARRIPELIDNGTIREKVQAMPVLNTDLLVGEAEWRRAYVMLAFMTHAYVWGGDMPEEILPPQISVPFLAVSAHVELPPVLTYAGANLWNFTSTGTDFTQIDDLSLLFSFTGTESESWFLLISVAMESKAAGILETMVRAVSAVKSRDYALITDSLRQLKDVIDSIGRLLDRMYEKCDPMTFYHRIRPFLAGSKNMDAAGLPRGVFYDEGNGKGEWRQLRGGSNGQSSLIQFFDVVLGVEHRSHGAPNFHAEVRDYMPGPHRRFLVHVERLGSIREFAMATSPDITEEQRLLRDAFTAATEALTVFRNKHIQIVTRYIILPSKQPWTGKKMQNLASSSSEKSSASSSSEDLTGTGGTPLVPFLKNSRDETIAAGILTKA